MGNVSNVDIDKFPVQGTYLGKPVEVCFNYNIFSTIKGVCVRDDTELPGLMIIKLDDNRYVLSTECQWRPL